jgi:SAM-dependent methyltransferase
MSYKLFSKSFPDSPLVPTLPLLPFQYSTCNAGDFIHPEFSTICNNLGIIPVFHRKLWEWVYITHHLGSNGLLESGNRGLVFGVGNERLPSFFASLGLIITATDAPVEIGNDWRAGDEYADSLDAIFYSDLVDKQIFTKNVSFRFADMNNIPDDLNGFDFCWSSCCFEHLGSLQNGVDFVLNSLNTLRPGGVAIHTTEYNLSSNCDTISEGQTVIYRKVDLEELIEKARAMGFYVESLNIAPDSFYLDNYVDVPPYTNASHLKLDLAGYVATSVGLIIKKPLLFDVKLSQVLNHKDDMNQSDMSAMDYATKDDLFRFLLAENAELKSRITALEVRLAKDN